MPMKEGRRNDRERIRDRETRGKRGGGGGREGRSGGCEREISQWR